MTKQELAKQKAAREKRIAESVAKQEARDAQMLEMQKAFTNIANNYTDFIGKMNKLIDKFEPILDKTLEKLKDEGLGS